MCRVRGIVRKPTLPPARRVLPYLLPLALTVLVEPAWPGGSAAALSSGLVAAYAFNEGTGVTAADVSGNGHTASVNDATWTDTGRYGKALSFNGTSSYVDLGMAAALQITASMPWRAWVLATANPADDGQIIAKSSSSGWQFKTSPDTGAHTFGVGVSPNSSSLTQRYSRTVRQLNTWYHVAGVYDAAARALNIYVNGVLDNGALFGTVPASQYNNPTERVTIGRRTGGYYFSGTIDEVRLHNRALSQAEIQTDMNTPVGGTADTQPPTAPSGLSATGASLTQINLAWTASTDNVGMKNYLVERCLGLGCATNFTQVASPTATTYSDTGLSASTTYGYRVRAIDAANNLSGYSSIASGTTLSDTQPPTVPSGLTATAVSPSQINLAWTASTDNVGIKEYRIESCAGAGCTTGFTPLATVTSTSYSNTGLGASSAFGSHVIAVHAAGHMSII